MVGDGLKTIISYCEPWRLILFASLGLITMGKYLVPSPVGHGTHLQLGLPPCLFLLLTGYPCPSCGLTTSFAHATHFHFAEALATQPFGLIFFLLVVLSIPLSIYALIRRVSWQSLIDSRGATRLVYVLTALYLLSWVYKLRTFS